MMIEYHFTFDDGLELSYQVDPDRSSGVSDTASAPPWTRLQNNQCSNCPLSPQDHAYCPAAIDLDHLARDFQHLPAHRKAMVNVVTPEREYLKRTTLEEGVRALMGLIMATSACPRFAELKANAHNHLPFASQEEYIIRASSVYLLKQYFIMRDGGEPDWELKGLVRINEQLQLVNHAFWQRIISAFQNDSNSKALLSFFNMSSSLTTTMESQMSRIRHVFWRGEGS